MKREKRDQRIGISIGCFLPWAIFPIVGLKIAARWADEIGCSFWQMLPLRGMSEKALRDLSLPIKYAEPAWNPVSLGGKLRGELGEEGSPATWLDVLLFPNPEVSQKRFAMILRRSKALPVSHRLQAVRRIGALVEVSPELRASSTYLARFAEGIGRRPYVIDTRHLRRLPRDGGESLLGPWQEALEKLLPYTALIHVQPLDRDELVRSLEGEITEMVQILFYLTGRYKGPLVIEVRPNILGPSQYLNPRRMVSTLRAFRELIN